MSTIIAILIVGVLVLIGFRLAIHFSQPKRPGKLPKTLRPSPPMRRGSVSSAPTVPTIPPTPAVPTVPTVPQPRRAP